MTARIEGAWSGALGLALAAALAGAIAAAAQQSAPPDTGGADRPPPVEQADLPLDSGVDLAELHRQVEERCVSVEQVRSVPLFSELVDRLEERRTMAALAPEQRAWLLRALFCRADAHVNRGETAEAEGDVRRLLDVDPSQDVPASLKGSTLGRLFAEVRGRTVGSLRLAVSPPDARVRIDGEPFGPEEAARFLLAGPHTVDIERPGHRPEQRQVLVEPGRILTLEAALERVSAVVSLLTRPAGASVRLDGRDAGATAPLPVVPGAAAGAEGPAGGDGILVIEGVEVGEHLLELSKPGFRSQRLALAVEVLEDRFLAPITLEPTAGTLILTGVPEGAALSLDGAPLADPRGRGPLRLAVAAGEHRVLALRGTLGVFERVVEVPDRQEVELSIRLRPSLVYLGVLGGQEAARLKFEEKLLGVLAGEERWAVRRSACAGPGILEGFGVGAAALRRLAAAEPVAEAPWDWAGLQRRLDERCTGSVYLVAVLPDEIYPTAADLWMVAAAGGPPAASRLSLDLVAAGGFEPLRAALTAELPLPGGWLGADVFDSTVGGRPVVYAVAAGGPAAGAGLQVGDELTAAAGAPVSAARDLWRAVAASEPGAALAVTVRRAGADRLLSVALGEGPIMLSPAGPAAPPPVLAAALAQAAAAGAVPDWLLALDRAAVLLLAGDAARALQALDGAQAPAGPGLGQAAVDYWFGVALERADYPDRAVEAFRRAVAAPEARLDAQDGPLVAPRARARIGAAAAPPAR